VDKIIGAVTGRVSGPSNVEEMAKAGRKPRKTKTKPDPPKYYAKEKAAELVSCIKHCPKCAAPVNDTPFGWQQHHSRMPQCDPSNLPRRVRATSKPSYAR